MENKHGIYIIIAVAVLALAGIIYYVVHSAGGLDSLRSDDQAGQAFNWVKLGKILGIEKTKEPSVLSTLSLECKQLKTDCDLGGDNGLTDPCKDYVTKCT